MYVMINTQEPNIFDIELPDPKYQRIELAWAILLLCFRCLLNLVYFLWERNNCHIDGYDLPTKINDLCFGRESFYPTC